MKKEKMGLIYADIELINTDDLVLVRRSIIDIDEVRKIHINMLVDTGSYMLAINENIQQILQLPVIDKRNARMADDSVLACDVVGPVLLKFKNRTAICSAMVLPGDSEPLLGAIPLEELDVVINPLKQELNVNPDSPDFATLKMKELTVI
jgi:clan AA aspartic protease